MKQRIIHSLGELQALEQGVVDAAAAAAHALAVQLEHARDISVLARLKFDPCGVDPLDLGRPLNFVEQLNQSFTYLATIEATRWLFERHPEHAPFQLNLGTASGPDIRAVDGSIVAETFAATHPDSNRKLQKDVAKLEAVDATHRYVFYLSRHAAKERGGRVKVIRLDHTSLRGLRVADT